MKILVAGLPRSGTTALFYKIKHSLASDVVCLFEPSEFSQEKAIPTHRTILVKVLISPWLDIDSFGSFDRKILIVRDPRDNFISMLLYAVRDTDIPFDAQKSAALIQVLRQKEKNSTSVTVLEIAQLIEELCPQSSPLQFWLQLNRLGANLGRKHKDYFILKYEDFVDGKLNELEGYLGFTVSGEAVVARRHKRVVRTKSYGDWRNWFEQEDVVFFRPLMSDYMHQYGYPDDWDLSGKGPISPEYGSKYIERIIRERKLRGVGLRIFGVLIRRYKAWRKQKG